MSEKSLDEFLLSFCEMLLKSDLEAIASIYHMPCIMMDRDAFAPCSKGVDIAELNQELIKLNVAKYKGASLKPVIKSVHNLSESLVLVNVLLEVLNEREDVVNSINLNLNVMDMPSAYSVVVVDFLNIEIPRIKRLIKYKSDELEYGLISKKAEVV